jgi:diguanylate cyclase
MADPELQALLHAAQTAYRAEHWGLCDSLVSELLDLLAAQPSALAEHLAVEISAHALLAHVAHHQGAHSRAAAHAASALALCQGLEDPWLQARSRIASARVSWGIGDNDQALVDLEAAMPAVGQCRDAEVAFDALNLLGIVYGELGNDEAALSWHQRALALAEQSGEARMRAIARANLADRALEQGEALLAKNQSEAARDALQRSLTLSEEALAISQPALMLRIQAVALSNQGAALALLGRAAEALQAFQQEQELGAAIGDRHGAVQRARYLAQMFRATGELARARELAAEGLQIGEALGAKSLLIPLYELASGLAEQQGDFADALALYKRFHALRSELALDGAQQRARVLGVRLETERALAEAASAKLHAQALRQTNEELTQRAEALGRDALEDALTGLANRRCLDAYLSLRHEAARRAGGALCVALIDLDHFKQINDVYSHDIGDQVLRQLSLLLQAQCRSQDLAARYGGEEFLIALDGVGLNAAGAICERLRGAIEAHDWQAIAPGLRVSASLGLCDIAEYPVLGDGMKQADALLYRAKQAGRNRVSA